MRPAAFAALALWLIVVTFAIGAFGRVPVYAMDPREGAWLGVGDVFIHESPNRWNVFPASATVNRLIVDDYILWVATDDGVIRFDTGTLRSTRLTMDDGLPSQVVKTVAADATFVWFGTNKGLVRYRKTDHTIKVYTEADGLPHRGVNDALAVGRQVWFATRGGLAFYNPDVDGIRGFTEKDGLASANGLELFQIGIDVWMRTDVGLSRFRTETRVFSNFSSKEIGGDQIRTFVQDGDTIWIATENGLAKFSASQDHIGAFPQQASLDGRSVVGIEVSPPNVFMTTDKGVAQYNETTNAFYHYSKADGLLRQEGAIGTLLVGSLYTVVFPDGAETLDTSANVWQTRSIEVTQTSERSTRVNAFGTFNGSTPYDFTHNQFAPGGYATAVGGVGFGQRIGGDRQLNGSVWLDYGQVDASGIRDLQYKVEYIGNKHDILRQIDVSDKLQYRYLEEGLDRPLLLQGARMKLSTPDLESKGAAEIHAGFRRGQVVRDFLTGPRQNVYQLTTKNIIPATERVTVDGMLLTSGMDYTIVYPAAQLTFLNPERIDDLSVISVEYEVDLMPKKDLGNLSALDLLPSNNEVGQWVQSGTPNVITDEAGLYNQIDGAAPKYINHGWTESVYATYQQANEQIQVAIHDMGSTANAQALFNYELPLDRQNTNPSLGTSVIDLGLTTAYASYSWTDRFVIELSISDKTDASKASLIVFTLEVLNRKQNAGAESGDPLREFLVSERVSVKPSSDVEIGARAVHVQQIGSNGVAGRELASGIIDERFQRAVGKDGLFTGYSELGGSHREDVSRQDGFAAMTLLRFSNPSLAGSATGRYQQEGYNSIGSDATRFGRMRDEAVVNLTGYPVSFMPTTVFFDRQSSYLSTGPGIGTLQHALARFQVNHEKYPAASIQVGDTTLDSPGFYSTNRVQVVGQTEYDAAHIIPYIKRFNINALYSISDASTREGTVHVFDDRVSLSRIEGRLSPTATDAIYALFRSRDVARDPAQQNVWERAAWHWELYSGAQTSVIPGLIPQLGYNVVYDDTSLPATAIATTSSSLSYGGLNQGFAAARVSPCGPSTTSLSPIVPAPGGVYSGGPNAPAMASATGYPGVVSPGGVNGRENPVGIVPGGVGACRVSANGLPGGAMLASPFMFGAAGAAVTPASAPVTVTPSLSQTNPVGPGNVTLGPSTRDANTTAVAALGIYPGRWLSSMGPISVMPAVSVTNDEKAVGLLRTGFERDYRFDNRAVYASSGKFSAQLYERYQVSTVDQDRHLSAVQTEFDNLFIYRPIPRSPITIQFNYLDVAALNNVSALLAGAGSWNDQTNYTAILEWLMRWNHFITTHPKATFELGTTRGMTSPDPINPQVLDVMSYNQWQAGVELELRFYPLPDASKLYVMQHNGIFRLFGEDRGSIEAYQWYVGVGTIWRVGDNIFLNTQWDWRQTNCVGPPGSSACVGSKTLVPLVLMMVNL